MVQPLPCLAMPRQAKPCQAPVIWWYSPCPASPRQAWPSLASPYLASVILGTTLPSPRLASPRPALPRRAQLVQVVEPSRRQETSNWHFSSSFSLPSSDAGDLSLQDEVVQLPRRAAGICGTTQPSPCPAPPSLASPRPALPCLGNFGYGPCPALPCLALPSPAPPRHAAGICGTTLTSPSRALPRLA